ncbi:MAG: hypothetical protein ABIP75_04260 [Pyrinomonadaceae bacterium]
MKNKCLDIITLQTYLDGELSVLEMENAASHLAACVACGEMAREMESELLFVGQALEPELTLAVPTAQLRARVYAAIDELPLAARKADSPSLLDRLRSLVSGFTPQMAFGLVSAVVVIGLVSWVGLSFMRAGNAGGEAIATVFDLSPGGDLPAWEMPDSPTPTDDPIITINRPRRVNPKGEGKIVDPLPAATEPLPGESTYLATIKDMNHSMAERDDLDVRPTLRADIERNLAVLDQAIASSRDQARRHPQDANAAAFLNAAYQNKIEFLRTVSDQAQLYAALR